MTVTLEQLHDDMKMMKDELRHLRTLIQEDFPLADDVAEEIEESRQRSSDEMISHEDMKKEFG